VNKGSCQFDPDRRGLSNWQSGTRWVATMPRRAGDARTTSVRRTWLCGRQFRRPLDAEKEVIDHDSHGAQAIEFPR
jgi:hypothetical protein